MPASLRDIMYLSSVFPVPVLLISIVHFPNSILDDLTAPENIHFVSVYIPPGYVRTIPALSFADNADHPCLFLLPLRNILAIHGFP